MFVDGPRQPIFCVTAITLVGRRSGAAVGITGNGHDETRVQFARTRNGATGVAKHGACLGRVAEIGDGDSADQNRRRDGEANRNDHVH